MKSLYLMGTPGSGKTVVALGLAQKFRKEGYKVGYFKPLANNRSLTGNADMDAILMKDVLNLKAPLNSLAPLNVNPSYLSFKSSLEEAMDNIIKAYDEVSDGYEVMLVDGALSMDIMGSVGLDCVSLAKKLGSNALLVHKIENDFSLDKAIFLSKYLNYAGVPAAGVVFSNVSRPLYSKTEGVYRPIMEQMGFKTLGVFPARPEIASPTVAEYYLALGGEILAGHDRTNLLVEDVVIGAMTIEGALTYLRRTANKAVILGGDRADLALAALETSTSVLILTGGLYPDVKVIARAEEKQVPVIMVHYDTYTTIEKLSQVSRYIKPADKEGIRVALENIELYCEWEYILESFKS